MRNNKKGNIAENPQFEADQMEDIKEERRKKKAAFFKNRKNITIIAILVLCLIGAGVIGGLTLTNDSEAKQANSETKIENTKDVGKTVEKDKKADSEKEKKSKDAKDKKANTEQAKKDGKTTSGSSEQKSSGSAKAPSNTNSGSKSGSSHSSGSSSSSGSSKPAATQPTQPPKPAHTHNWVAHTATRSVPYTETEYYQVTVCVDCGIERPSGNHCLDHAENGGTGARKEVTKSRTVTKYRTESYTDYYYCSCGATK